MLYWNYMYVMHYCRTILVLGISHGLYESFVAVLLQTPV